MTKSSEILKILIRIKTKPNISQRELAKKLGFSIGKINYCVNDLKRKGLIKVDKYKNNLKKKYLYTLTSKGISEKTLMSIEFIKKTVNEYDQIKKEVSNSLNFDEIKGEINDAERSIKK